MDKIIIFGNSVFAEHIYYLLTHDSKYEVVAFTVDKKYIVDNELFGLPVVPFETVEKVYSPQVFGISVAISFQRVNKLREEKYIQARAKGYQLINYVSSRALVLSEYPMGDNCIISENSSIGPFVRIGNDVFIGTGAMIGHHVVIKDHCFISPGAVVLGGVTVEEFSLIGANATVKEEVKIARESIVGIGASITKDTKEGGVYFNPPPQLYGKRSDELMTWLTWPLRARKSSGETGQK